MIEKRRIKKLLRTVGGKRERREGGTSMVRNKGDREQPKSKVYGKKIIRREGETGQRRYWKDM